MMLFKKLVSRRFFIVLSEMLSIAFQSCTDELMKEDYTQDRASDIYSHLTDDINLSFINKRIIKLIVKTKNMKTAILSVTPDYNRIIEASLAVYIPIRLFKNVTVMIHYNIMYHQIRYLSFEFITRNKKTLKATSLEKIYKLLPYKFIMRNIMDNEELLTDKDTDKVKFFSRIIRFDMLFHMNYTMLIHGKNNEEILYDTRDLNHIHRVVLSMY